MSLWNLVKDISESRSFPSFWPLPQTLKSVSTHREGSSQIMREDTLKVLLQIAAWYFGFIICRLDHVPVHSGWYKALLLITTKTSNTEFLRHRVPQ